MIIKTVTQVGRYCAPRSRGSKWCLYLVLCLLLICIISYKSGFLHYFIVAHVLQREHYSMQELVDMIPYEAKLKDLRKDSVAHNEVKELELGSESFTCKELDPKAVFVIRIAKCASTSFVQLLKTFSKNSNYDLFFHSSGAYDWDVRTMKQVADMVKKKPKRFVYARHFYYVDFRPFNLDNFTYVTFVRDPVSRFVSSFLYYHYSSRAHIQSILDPAHKNETLLDCLHKQHEGCAHNLMTKYFCGHHRFCKLGNEEALSLAMENVKKDFAVVGLVEEMELSLKLLVKTMPSYFSKLTTEAGIINKNEHQRELTSIEVEAIKAANSADIKLYDYAQKLLKSKAVACGLLTHNDN